jgi:hypothetical protein
LPIERLPTSVASGCTPGAHSPDKDKDGVTLHPYDRRSFPPVQAFAGVPTMLHALFATVLVFVSVGLLLYLLSLLVAAARAPLGGLVERRRFAWHVAHARSSDAFLARGEVDAALLEVRHAFCLAPMCHTALLSAVANHHTALLSRVLAIVSERHDGSLHLLSLARTDRLLAERSELQRRYATARAGGTRTRVKELRSLLAANRRELEATLDRLIGEARAACQPRRPQ